MSIKQSKYLLFCIIFLSANFKLKAQVKQIKYKISVAGINVGELSSLEKIVGFDTIVESITNVQIRVVFNYKIRILQKSTFRSGELLKSGLYTYKNNQLNSSTELIKSGAGYTLIKDTETSYINERIGFSGSLLYFHEPKNVESFYFELNGTKSSVKQVAEHAYVIINPETGRKHKYEYENGILKRSSIEYMMATIYTERL